MSLSLCSSFINTHCHFSFSESCSDEDFIVEGDEELQETEEEEELVMSSMSDSGSEYGRRRKRGSKKKKKVPLRSRDLGPVRRSSRNLGRERKVYQDSTSSGKQHCEFYQCLGTTMGL